MVAVSVPASESMAKAAPVLILADETQNGKSFDLTSYQCLIVQLLAQTDGGYDWKETADSTPLLKLESNFSIPTSQLLGAPSEHIFIFCPAGTGKGLSKLEESRPWEKNTPPAETFSVEVKIGK